MSVTLPGGQGLNNNVILSLGTGDVLHLSQKIGHLLEGLVTAQPSKLTVSTVQNGDALESTAGSLGTTAELLIQPGAMSPNQTVPAGWDYVVLDATVGNAPATTLTGTGSGVRIVSGTDSAVFGAGSEMIIANGTSTVAANGGNNTVSATGNYLLSFGPGNNLIHASGAGTVATGNGADTIYVNGTSGAHNLVLAGTGSDTVYVTGTHEYVAGNFQHGSDVTVSISGSSSGNVVNANGSNVRATTSGSGAFVQGGLAGTTLTAVDLGSRDVFNGLSSNEVATLSGSGAYFQGGTAGTKMHVIDGGMHDTINALGSALRVTANANSSNLYVNGDAATSTVFGSSRGTTVVSGTGGVLFGVNGMTNQVLGQTGSTSTIYGGANPSSVTFSGPGNLVYSAALGNATLNAAGETGWVRAWLPGTGSGADSVVTGSGNDTITAGAGSDTLNAGSGTNLFLFVNDLTAGATDYITDSAANATKDLFSFNNYGSAPTESVSRAGVNLTLSDGTKVIFTQLTSMSELNGHLNIYNAPG